MKILLIKPWMDSFNWYHSHMLGLAYLAGYIRSIGYDVDILDAAFLHLDQTALLSELKYRQADVFGITAMTHEIPRANIISKFLKSEFPDRPIILGGPHASARPAETLQEIPSLDFIVAGEGEKPVQHLLHKLDSANNSFSNIKGLAYRTKDGPVFNGAQTEFIDLKKIPQPAVDLYYSKDWFVNHPKSEYRLFASRGCPFKCAYCMRVLGNRVRWRDPEAVVKEWVTAVNYYKAKVVFLHDEIFLYDNPYTHMILDGILESKIHHKAIFNAMTHVKLIDEPILKKAVTANCYKLCIGVESGNNSILKRVNRSYSIEEAKVAIDTIKKHGIRPFTFFILGHPNETHKTIRDTIHAAVKLNPFEIGMGIMVPYPGTEIYELAKKNKAGYRLTDVGWDGYDRYGGRAMEFSQFSYRQLLIYQITGYLLFFVLNGRIKGMFNYFAPKFKAVFRLIIGKKL